MYVKIFTKTRLMLRIGNYELCNSTPIAGLHVGSLGRNMHGLKDLISLWMPFICRCLTLRVFC